MEERLRLYFQYPLSLIEMYIKSFQLYYWIRIMFSLYLPFVKQYFIIQKVTHLRTRTDLIFYITSSIYEERILLFQT